MQIFEIYATLAIYIYITFELILTNIDICCIRTLLVFQYSLKFVDIDRFYGKHLNRKCYYFGFIKH